MRAVLPLSEVASASPKDFGGKAVSLGALLATDASVPDAICISRALYDQFLDSNGLRERIQLELSRKSMTEMRWEELWDAALRIRNMFLKSDMTEDLSGPLLGSIQEAFDDRPVVVRSSAPDEDAANASFAGLHESYVNVRGAEKILQHIRLVWASLWSDSALLYRKELKLNVADAAMAVIVQELIEGDASGVVFSRDPNGGESQVIEAVHGLNQGLVDGTVQPDRWTVDPEAGTALQHTAAERTHRIALSPCGVFRQALPEDLRAVPPLDGERIAEVARLSKNCENFFAKPQDTEWTYRGSELFILQSRPITTGEKRESDGRSWYKDLSRTMENLQSLRQRIESEIVPGMLSDASQMAGTDFAAMSDESLCDEINRRAERFQHWIDVYWTDLIPFAHGARLFGQVYNDIIKPDNPHSFTDLLATQEMNSVTRNRDLEALADHVRSKPALAKSFQSGYSRGIDSEFDHALDQFIDHHGDLSTPLKMRSDGPPVALIKILLQLASRAPATSGTIKPDADELARDFLAACPEEQREHAAELLDLARASYQLRDDDNIYIHGVEMQLDAAVVEGRRRLQVRGETDALAMSREQVQLGLGGRPVETSGHRSPNQAEAGTGKSPVRSTRVQDLQLIGQPACPGVASGPARVIQEYDDLMEFKRGEILVCDAISPTITFAVPLAAAIIERRGGMLIHGAIIAREYGIPCVTGVPDAAERIHTGNQLTVDGYLGIVRVD